MLIISPVSGNIQVDEDSMRVLDAVKVTECHITSLKSIEVVGHEVAITYNLRLLSKMNERSFDPANGLI